jgi:hypothetical protein
LQVSFGSIELALLSSRCIAAQLAKNDRICVSTSAHAAVVFRVTNLADHGAAMPLFICNALVLLLVQVCTDRLHRQALFRRKKARFIPT